MNIYSLKRGALLIISLILIVYSNGCHSSKEMDSIAFVTGIGLDKSPEKSQPLEFSALIAKVNNAGGESAQQFLVERVNAEHISQAMEKLKMSSSRTPFYQHHRIIIVGRQQAKDGIGDYLDSLMRHHEIRLESLFLVADKSAAEFLSSGMPLDLNPAVGVSKMMGNTYFGDFEKENRFLNFLSRTLDFGKTALVPIIGVGDDQSSAFIKSIAVFNDSIMVGEFDLEEYFYYTLLTSKLSSGTINLEGDWGRASFSVTQSEYKNRVEIYKDEITLSAKVDLKLSTENLNIGEKTTNLEDLRWIEKIVASHVEEKLKKTLEKSKEVGADVFNVGKEISKIYPNKWSDFEARWDELYRTVELNPDINVKIEDIGKTAGISP